jgi:enoyl-CoA hydratase/carnithine racemase
MATQYRKLSFKEKDNAAIIGLPGFSGNYADPLLYDELADACSEIELNDDIKAVIITDADKTILKKDIIPPIGNDLPGTCSGRLTDCISEIDRPVIAAICGDAFGQGLELAMSCDIRIASDKSKFGLPFIRNGLIPEDGGTQRLPRLAGRGKALEMILTGDEINAEEACRIGLVNRIISYKNVLNTALRLAADIASKAPVAVRFAREAIYNGADLSLDQALRMEGDLYLLLFGTHDRVNGIQSFKEKKTPAFRGE